MNAHTPHKKDYDIQRVLDHTGVTQTYPSSVGRLMKTPPDRHINNLNFQRPAFTPDLLKLSPAPESRRGRGREEKLPWKINDKSQRADCNKCQSASGGAGLWSEQLASERRNVTARTGFFLFPSLPSSLTNLDKDGQAGHPFSHGIMCNPLLIYITGSSIADWDPESTSHCTRSHMSD